MTSNTRQTGERAALQDDVERNQFGTFAGVFTPTVLTILGVILFMRSNFVVGQTGIINALIILVVAKGITFFTTLSISAIATNTRVEGGGAYFLISRSLGPEFGGAIGLTLFIAQALSVPFYILGFTEAFVTTFPAAQPYFTDICLTTALLLFTLAWVGAGWAIKAQYIVLSVLVVAILSFLIGAALAFDPATFQANLSSAPAEMSPVGFWFVFAIYFPAVTGIMTGVNMSGDLRDPSTAIPRGTLWAILVAALVYGLQVILCGGAVGRADLIDNPYGTMVSLSLFGAGFIIVGGVFAATLSSAIGSFVAAPRVLQALARDDILRPVRYFAHGTVRGDEPRRALWLTLGITLLVILAVGSASEGGALNQVAAVVSMFFLAAYGVTNWAAFVEAASANPSFRPRFRFFHWTVALLGAVGCGAAALLIDPGAALAAVAIIAILFFYVRQRDLEMGFGDARRGFIYTKVRNNLLRLGEMPRDAKNWRPTAIVLSGNPETRETLVRYALWLEAGRGMVSIVQLIVGELRDCTTQRREALDGLNDFIRSRGVPAFPEVAVVHDFDKGLRVLLQTHSIGPLKANLLLFGWSNGRERADAFADHLRSAAEMGMSMVILRDRGLPERHRAKRIDVWWRGRENGSLMLILAHLLLSNPEWARSQIRVLRLARTHEESVASEEAVRVLVEAARMNAEVHAVVSDRPFAEVLHEESAGASVVFLGFYAPPPEQAGAFHEQYTALLDGLPTTLLVHSSGEADLLA